MNRCLTVIRNPFSHPPPSLVVWTVVNPDRDVLGEVILSRCTLLASSVGLVLVLKRWLTFQFSTFATPVVVSYIVSWWDIRWGSLFIIYLMKQGIVRGFGDIHVERVNVVVCLYPDLT